MIQSIFFFFSKEYILFHQQVALVYQIKWFMVATLNVLKWVILLSLITVINIDDIHGIFIFNEYDLFRLLQI